MVVKSALVLQEHSARPSCSLVRMSQPQLPPSGRVVELDALRGLAALAVVAFHYSTRYDQLFGRTEALPFSLTWGHYGVDLFFMLSGLVILMSLERCRGAVHFAWGRLTRLYPTYWCAAITTCVVVWSCGLPGQEVSAGDALLNVTMLQALLGAEHIDGAYWSLQAELIFYGNMLALYLMGALKKPARAVLVWVGVALAVHAAISVTAVPSPAITSLLTKVRTLGSLEFIPLFGLGLLLHTHVTGRSNRESIVAAAACATAIGMMNGLATLAVDAVLATVLVLAAQRQLPALRAPALVWLGAISYPLYLIHQNIGYVVIQRFEQAGANPVKGVIAATLLAVLLASWLHRGVEVPSLASLRKIDPTRWFRRSAPSRPLIG